MLSASLQDTIEALRCALGDVWSCSIALESSTVEYKFAILDDGDEVCSLLTTLGTAKCASPA